MDREELFSQLSAVKVYDLTGAIRGPDLGAEAAKEVFTARIRHLSRLVPTHHRSLATRSRLLERRDISALHDEMAKWLLVAEQKDEFGETIRTSFKHFFAHTEWAMEVLADLSSPFITEEEQDEVEALAKLAETLCRLFIHAPLYREESVLLLKRRVRDWAAKWYPDWEPFSSDDE